MLKVLFVCTMSVCRSPAAEAVFRQLLKDAGMLRQVLAGSAGTRGHFAGEAPDPRMQTAARRRGYELSKLRARQVRDRDFHEFDYLLGMDRGHVAALAAACPPGQEHKIGLLLDYAPGQSYREVPDPYYGPAAGFELVLDLIEQASRGLLARILAQYPGKVDAAEP